MLLASLPLASPYPSIAGLHCEMRASAVPRSTKCVYEVSNGDIHAGSNRWRGDERTCQVPAVDPKRPGEEITPPGLLILNF